jgi:hypothetical protein
MRDIEAWCERIFILRQIADPTIAQSKAAMAYPCSRRRTTHDRRSGEPPASGVGANFAVALQFDLCDFIENKIAPVMARVAFV